MIKCQAHVTATKDILIKNPYKDRAVTYNVETDLIGASSDVSSFTI